MGATPPGNTRRLTAKNFWWNTNRNTPRLANICAHLRTSADKNEHDTISEHLRTKTEHDTISEHQKTKTMTQQNILIIGAGGHAAELRDYIRHYNQATGQATLTVIGFIDDDPKPYHHYGFEEPFLGDIKSHEVRQDCHYIMGIANLKYRKAIIERFRSAGATFTGLIHPTALVSPSAEIGEGVVISHNASVGPKVKIGNYNMLNSRCTVGHDTQIGDYNFISPKVALSGNTKIGDNNMIGTNASTIPGATIGNNNTVGAGMVVYKNIGDNETVFFRFKERLVIRGQ